MRETAHLVLLIYLCLGGSYLAFASSESSLTGFNDVRSRSNTTSENTFQNFIRSKRDSQDGNKDSNSTVMLKLKDAYRLLELGTQRIDLRENLRNLTLVVGLSGAGKTTMTLLLSEKFEILTSGKRGSDIYIKGPGISDPKLSVISKSIFPELVIDNVTKDALYDCPGFKDTRDASVEIANTVFMKQVADHAHRVRILVIVEYSSVRPMGERFGYTDLVSYLLGFIRNISKFKNSLAMIVTKVEKSDSFEELVEGVVEYIRDAQTAWSKEGIPDKIRASMDKIDDLTNSFLLKDENGKYSNIGIFKQPNSPEKKLSEIPDVVKNREKLLQMVFNNPNFQYQEKDKADFGTRLSAESVRVAEKMIRQLVKNTTAHLEKLHKNLTISYVQKMSDILLFGLKDDAVRNDTRLLNESITNMSKGCGDSQLSASSGEQLIGLTNKINVTLDTEVLKILKEETGHVEFLDDVSGATCEGSGTVAIREEVVKVMKHLLTTVQSFSGWFKRIHGLVDNFTQNPSSSFFLNQVKGLNLSKNGHFTQETVIKLNLMSVDELKSGLNNIGPEDKLNLLKLLLSLLPLDPDGCHYDKENQTVWVRGHIFTSSQVETCMERHNKEEIRNLVIFSTWVFFLEKDMNGTALAPQNRHHGLNLILIAPTVRASESRTISLDGAAGKDHESPEAAKGVDGEPGRSGGNGGQFFGVIEKLEGDVKITANGGTGGQGQQGGEGVDGKSADSVTLNDIQLADDGENITVTTNYSVSKDESNRNCLSPYPCTTFEVRIPDKEVDRRSFGKDGGVGGLGGYAGSIVIKEQSKLKTESRKGLVGEGGEGGRPGPSGKPAMHLRIQRIHTHISQEATITGAVVGAAVGIVLSTTIFVGGVRAIGAMLVDEPPPRRRLRVYTKETRNFCGSVGSLLGGVIVVGAGAVGGYFLGYYLTIFMESPGEILVLNQFSTAIVNITGVYGASNTNNRGQQQPETPPDYTPFFNFAVKELIEFAKKYSDNTFLHSTIPSLVETLEKL